MSVETKKCSVCKQEKPLTEFYRDHRGYYQSYCKTCKRVNAKKYRTGAKYRKYIRDYMRERRKTHKSPKPVITPELRAAKREATRTYRSKPVNQAKRHVRSITEGMLRRGEIFKEPCLLCGNPDSEIHHPNYSNPLYIVFLCKTCHGQLHSGINNPRFIRDNEAAG